MLLALALAVLPQWGTPSILDPTVYRSPSGTYRLRVDPQERDGKGPAKYEFDEQGRRVWSAELDFTLSAVAVSDAGLVVGYGRRGEERGMDTFIVAVLDRTGELLLEERTPFTVSRFIHVSANPVARGLVPDFEHDRFFVRVADPDVNRGIQAWWAYRASTGERLETLEPGLAMAESAPDAPDSFLHLMDARALAGTGLILVHWRRTDLEDYSQGFYASGAVFTLMRSDASCVWRLDLPGDYSVAGDKRATRDLKSALRGEDMILGTGIDGHFELRFVKAGQRVHLQALPDEGAPGAWRVDELYREPFAAEPESAEPGPRLPTEVELPVSSKVVLEQAGAEGSALLQGMRAWDFDGPDGGFLLVRAEADGHFVRERLDRQGQRIEARAIDPLPSDPDGGFVNWETLGNDTWLITRTSYGEDESREFHAIADGSTGEWFELDGLATADVSGVAFSIDQGALLPDGNLVALGMYSFEYSMTDALFCLDRTGRVLWAVHGDYEDNTKLFSPKDVTVTADGLVAVLQNVVDRIQVYDSAGSYVRSIDLEQAWGQEPGYLTGILADPSGGVLVRDFASSVHLWLMDLEGQRRRPIKPHFEDGRYIRELTDHARVSADGVLWTTDGFTLVRLDEAGLVVESLGAELDRSVLYEPGPAQILPDGRICILDKRTGALHVWSETGKQLFVGASKSGDEDVVNDNSHMVSDETGAIWAMVSGDRYLGWSAAGERLGLRDFGGAIAFLPGSKKYWVWSRWSGASLRDGEGLELAHVERHPSGRWLRAIDSVSFGPGGVAYLSESTQWNGASPQGFVVQCSSDGQAQAAWQETTNRYAGKVAFLPGHWRVPDASEPIVLLPADQATDDVWLRLTGAAIESADRFALSSDGQALLGLDLETSTVYRFELPGAR